MDGLLAGPQRALGGVFGPLPDRAAEGAMPTAAARMVQAPPAASGLEAPRGVSGHDDLLKTLEASQEEKSIFGSEREQRKKSIDERGFEGVERLMPVQRIEHLWKLLNGPQSARSLQSGARFIYRSARDNGHLPADLAQCYPDSFHRYLALKASLAMATEAGNDEAATLIAAAVDALARGQGPALQASINAAEAMAGLPGSAEERERLRRFYSDKVPGGAGPLDILEALRSDFGDEGLGDALQGFQRALAGDRKATSRSAPPERLERLLHGMKSAGLLWSGLEGAGELRAKLSGLGMAIGPGATAALACGLFGLVDDGANARSLGQMADRLQVPAPLRAPFFRAVEQELAAWDPQLWALPNHRADLLAALRQQAAKHQFLA